MCVLRWAEPFLARLLREATAQPAMAAIYSSPPTVLEECCVNRRGSTGRMNARARARACVPESRILRAHAGC